MTLEDYQYKRDFRKTPQPPRRMERVEGRRFVVHKHQARRLHFDFRLEMDGVLKSWAVPKGPPQTIGLRRLAVEVEDHPLEYINFAGEIPPGHYGAGRVEVWDSGTYQLTKREADRLEFALSGQRLWGNYVLIHTEGKNWLMLKRKTALQEWQGA